MFVLFFRRYSRRYAGTGTDRRRRSISDGSAVAPIIRACLERLLGYRVGKLKFTPVFRAWRSVSVMNANEPTELVLYGSETRSKRALTLSCILVLCLRHRKIPPNSLNHFRFLSFSLLEFRCDEQFMLGTKYLLIQWHASWTKGFVGFCL